MKRYELITALMFVASGQMASESGDQWAKKMNETRGRIKAKLGAVTFKPLSSKVLKGSMEPQKLKVGVSGIKFLYLKTKGIPNYSSSHSAWGEPTLTTVDGKTVKLNSLKPKSVKVGWGKLLKNKDFGNKPIKIGKKTMSFGLTAHADSVLVYKLNKKYKSFSSYVGIAASGNGGAQFTVSSDAFESVLADVNTVKTSFPEYLPLVNALGTDWLLGNGAAAEKALLAKFEKELKSKASSTGLAALVELQELKNRFKAANTKMALFNKVALKRAINDLSTRYPEKFTDKTALLTSVKNADSKAIISELKQFKKAALTNEEKLSS